MRALPSTSIRRLRRSGRGKACLALACAAGVVLASVAGSAPAYATPSASASPPPGVPLPGAVPTSSITLPGGDRVVLQGASGSQAYDVVGRDSRTVPFLRFDPGNGHDYVIPASALSNVASLDTAQYDVPQLSHSAAPASPPHDAGATQLSAAHRPNQCEGLDLGAGAARPELRVERRLEGEVRRGDPGPRRGVPSGRAGGELRDLHRVRRI